MPNILFRADAEKSIGVGDLMSLIYLSSEFRKNSWRCFFAVRDYEPALKIVKQHNLENAFLLPRNISLEDEIDFVRSVCRKENIDCLLMEVTKNNLLEYKTLKRPAPIKACVNFDGIITNDFDIVVNWCIDASDDLYRSYEGRNIRFILGFENVILPHYLNQSSIKEKSPRKSVKNILITTGGTDEFNLTGKLLQILSLKTDEFEIRVIVGPGYENQEDLSRFKNFILKQDVSNLLDEYRWADIAISAGGLTSSELVAAKIPAVLIATYEHQIKRCEYYSKNGWAYYAGFHNQIDEGSILKSLDCMIKNIDLFRSKLYQSDFRGGNEKIYKSINSYRQSTELV